MPQTPSPFSGAPTGRHLDVRFREKNGKGACKRLAISLRLVDRAMIYLPLLATMLFSTSPVQQQRTNYQRVVEQPDPNNGYEDYVRASDMARGQELGLCLGWSERQYDDMLAEKQAILAHENDPATKNPLGELITPDKWDSDQEARLAMAKQLHDMGYLGVQRYQSD